MKGDLTGRQFGCLMLVVIAFIVMTKCYRMDRDEWNRQCRAAHGVPVSHSCIRADTIGIPWPPKK